MDQRSADEDRLVARGFRALESDGELAAALAQYHLQCMAVSVTPHESKS